MAQKLRHRRPRVIRIELEVDVVDDLPILLPQSQVMPLHLIVVEGRDGGEGYDSALLQLRHQPSYALREGVGVGLEVLVVDVDAVQVVLLDDAGEGSDGVVDPGVDRGRGEVGEAPADGVATEADREAHVRVAALDGGGTRGGQVLAVPEDVEVAIGGGGGVEGGVVDGEGEDEVELDAGVDGDVGEADAVE